MFDCFTFIYYQLKGEDKVRYFLKCDGPYTLSELEILVVPTRTADFYGKSSLTFFHIPK